jgi:Uri superfamily endonuclease
VVKDIDLSIPSAPGCYALQLHLENPQSLQVGRLGEYKFPAGDYIYLGSALGPGGLKARLGRHLRVDGRLHWHIDWLRTISVVSGYYFLESELSLECHWSQRLMTYPGVSVPAPRFGSSDCKTKEKPCAAHLVWFKSGAHLASIHKILSTASGSKVVYRKFQSGSQSQLGHLE